MPEKFLVKSTLEEFILDGIYPAFIVRNKPLERLLFDRNLLGLDFTQACEEASRLFLLHFKSELMQLNGNISELMVLTKGMYYWFHSAYQKAFNQNLEINFVATNRVEVIRDAVRVEVRTSNFDASTDNLIIGDTLASGETISAVLTHYMKHHALKKVFIFCIAGSVVGGKKLFQFCKANNIDLYLVYGLAAFGLGDNGFDLSFLHPDTITSNEYREKARKIFYNKPISSVGWDFGTQAQAIRKYRMLCWIEAKYWELAEGEVFSQTIKPSDPKLVQKERDAYSDRIPDISKLCQ